MERKKSVKSYNVSFVIKSPYGGTIKGSGKIKAHSAKEAESITKKDIRSAVKKAGVG
jgi:hypothetical protein